jgi:hypothetical protein
VYPQGDSYKLEFKDGVEGTTRFELTGRAAGERLTFNGSAFGATWSGEVTGDKLTAASGGKKMELTLSARGSPTLGKAPPLGEWQNKNWKALPGGIMEVSGRDNRTLKQFGSMQLHIEFMTPYMPGADGQGRGNSGVYLQDRYEVQVLDSFGLVSQDNDCGGIYKVAVPKVNACLPPLVWQTYDITFRAPKIAGGRVTRNVEVTVVHNGITIHDKVEVPGSTGGAVSESPAEKAPLRLQDHGNPVRYRNIWVVEVRD